MRLLAGLLAFTLIAAACGGDDDTADGATEATDDSGGDDGGTDDGGPEDDDSASSDGDDSALDGGDDESTVETLEDDGPAEDAVAGGTIRIGLEADVDGLNPTSNQVTAAPGLAMASAVFDTLAAFDTEGNAVPYLAESFTPNDDFTQWTVKLREGVVFHDGEPLNADALITNYDLQRSNALVGLAVKPFTPEEGGAVKVDDLTVTFTILDANANWPGSVAGQLGMVASPKWIAAAADDPTLNQEPVGTGPFVFASRSEDSVTRFERNENYWGTPALLDAVEFVPVTDSNTRTDLLLQGELQAMHTTNPEDVEILRDSGGIERIEYDNAAETFLQVNTAAPPFDDIRVRQALTFATPKQNYLDLIGIGVLRSADQMFSPESRFHDPEVVQEADVPDQAAPLVAEYCGEFPDNCSDGKVNMEYQWSGPSVIQTRIAELFDEGWNEYFNVSFDELPQDQHINEVVFGLYNAALWRQFGTVDPGLDNVWLLCRTVGPLSLNFPRQCDEARDQLLLDGIASTDQTAREQIYKDVSRNINGGYAYIFLTHTLWMHAFDESVQGVCGRTSPEGVELLCSIAGHNWYNTMSVAG